MEKSNVLWREEDYINYYKEEEQIYLKNDMLDLINETNMSGYQMYLVNTKEEQKNKENEDGYFFVFDNIFDFIKILNVESNEDITNISWNEQMQEFTFASKEMEYKLGVL
ncbi:hypothetical protein ACQPUR_03230 [Clostridium neonatale]|uniref:hypothetical protein n=1 Tax=Clostridium neonatale TaxID=137838 RepID=UPI003D32D335